jgi:hypothetical protein
MPGAFVGILYFSSIAKETGTELHGSLKGLLVHRSAILHFALFSEVVRGSVPFSKYFTMFRPISLCHGI